MKKFKLFALLMAMIMVLSACGGKTTEENNNTGTSTETSTETATTETAETTDTTAATEETTELTMAFFIFGAAPANLLKVEEAINAISVPEINTKVTLLPVNLGSYTQQINLMLSGNEKLDLFVGFGNSMPGYVESGQVVPMDDLLNEHGIGIKTVLGDYLEATRLNGELYGVTTIRDLATSAGFVFRKDLLDKYNFDYSKPATLEEVGAFMAQIKANETELVPIGPGAAGVSIMYPFFATNYDAMIAGAGIDYVGDPKKIVNVYGTESYKNALNIIKDWNNKGYIIPDAATNAEGAPALVKAGLVAGYTSVLKPGMAAQESAITGNAMEVIEVYAATTKTGNASTLQWCIARNSEKPEKATQFLNLMYTNADIQNLLSYGVKDEDYVLNTEGFAAFPEGVDPTNTKWGLNMGWLMGNQYITHIWSGNPKTMWDDLKAFNEGAKKSPAYGFSPSSTTIINEITAITNVVNQYEIALGSGQLDVDTELPKFISALNDAGIEKVIQEIQMQYDEWQNK